MILEKIKTLTEESFYKWHCNDQMEKTCLGFVINFLFTCSVIYHSASSFAFNKIK